MRLLIFSILSTALLAGAGCKSQAPTTDPFFGRTTIPPPPTGAAFGQGQDASYQPPPLAPSQPSTGAFPPMVQMPSQPTAQSGTNPSTAPGPAPAYTPPPTTSPNYSLPNTTPAYRAPRPSSTMPPASSTPSPGTSPYLPPSGSFDFRGAATRNSTYNSRTTAPVYSAASLARGNNIASDRTPRPVDDPATGVSTAGQPTASNRSIVDITDLPKPPSSRP